jgi:hypothetical protein
MARNQAGDEVFVVDDDPTVVRNRDRTGTAPKPRRRPFRGATS